METANLLWRVNGSETTTAIWVEGIDGERICTVRNCNEDADRARLIAASPLMKEALHQARLALAHLRGKGDKHAKHYHAKAMAKIDSALDAADAQCASLPRQ